MYRFRYFIYRTNLVQIAAGAAIILFAELSLILKLESITVWTTPICWTGYIILLNGILLQIKGNSIISNLKWNFLLLLVISFVSWLVFEWHNIFISNWRYLNLIKPLFIRYIGYFWAFAAIFPAIIITFELLYHFNIFRKVRFKRIKLQSGFVILSFLLGLVFIALPAIALSTRFLARSADYDLFLIFKYIFPEGSEKYMAAFIWLGYILLLDPINFLSGNWSMIGDLKRGKVDIILNLCLAGLICGILWEFWNFWAYTKWIYDIPSLISLKIFEMPVLGYFGFSAFAIEVFEVYQLFFGKKYYLP